MKRVRFRDKAGSERFGELIGETIDSGNGKHHIEEVDVLPPCSPTKIVGAGGNNARHLEQMDLEPPNDPDIFLKPPNTVTGYGDTIPLPVNEEYFGYEVELGVVIGSQCRNVSKDQAMDFVDGFTCVNDITRRGKDGSHEMDSRVLTKTFDNTTSIGPAIADKDMVPDNAEIELYLNGNRKQHGYRTDMVFSTPEIIEYASGIFTLEPGDLILTGTPPKPGKLKDGDHIELEIEGVGRHHHYVVDEG